MRMQSQILQRMMMLSRVSDSFDPASVFTAADTGGIYDARDRSTTFQDLLGTTPALLDGDAVASIASKPHAGTVLGLLAGGVSGDYVLNATGMYSPTSKSNKLDTPALGSPVNFSDGLTMVGSAEFMDMVTNTAYPIGVEDAGTIRTCWQLRNTQQHNLVHRAVGNFTGTLPSTLANRVFAIRTRDGDPTTADFYLDDVLIGSTTGAHATWDAAEILWSGRTWTWTSMLIINRRLDDEDFEAIKGNAAV